MIRLRVTIDDGIRMTAGFACQDRSWTLGRIANHLQHDVSVVVVRDDGQTRDRICSIALHLEANQLQVERKNK